MKKALSKTDILIYVSVAAAAVFLLVYFAFFTGGGRAADSVVIRSEGGVRTLPLSENETLDISSCGINLTVEIKDGGVRVLRASCPDKCCVETGRISRAGQSIVCLPAHVTVTLEGEGGQYDANAG